MGLLRRDTAMGRLLKPVGGSRLLTRRTTLGRAVERVGGTDLPSTLRRRVHAQPKTVKSGLAAVGGLIGVTAGSAAVSARRRRGET
jgi:hypothetical protein